MSNIQKTIILIGGLPGAGKTTLGQELWAHYGARATLIDPDETRIKVARFLQDHLELQPDNRLANAPLFHEPDIVERIYKAYAHELAGDEWKNDQNDHPWFYHTTVTKITIDMMIEAARAFEGDIVIVPSAFVTAASRARFTDFARDINAKLYRFWIDLDDHEVLAKRIKGRLQAWDGQGIRPPDTQALAKALSVFEPEGLAAWVKLCADKELINKVKLLLT